MKLHLLFYLFSFVSLLFISCENDIKKIQKVSYKPTDPDERTRNIKLIQTDSGFAKIALQAKLSETYHKPSTIIKFREGIEITLYTKTGKVQSILTALYGEIFQETGEMLFRDSVCLKNMQEKQSLLTEELHWNQNTQAIFTPKNVIVRSADGSLFYGDGIKTSLDFKQYEFIRPKGKFKIN
jgi:LPS export ABC transporter protein LptC